MIRRMTVFLLALAYGALAGLMIPLGGALARLEHLQPQWLEQEFRHSVIAFGGGILIAAVALVLVPEGLVLVPIGPALCYFFAGGAGFALFDHLRQRRSGDSAQLSAMLTDFVPEALSLGAIMASRSGEGALLALLIAAQNLPEAFNAWRELEDEGRVAAHRVKRLFWALALLGPVAVGLGYLVLAEWPHVTGATMMAAAGGILYLMFQDIAVKAHLQYRQAPPLAALAGFSVGMIGQALLGAGGG